MSAQKDDYEKLSKEEREARDKADRQREAVEQAGAFPSVFEVELSLTTAISFAL